MNGLRYGSLFSGYLGLDMGVQSVLGGTTAWVSDIDKGACKILEHRAPAVPNLGDITTVDWSHVESVDVLTGGFPCQDVSGAGKRAGMKPDNRSGLWSQFAFAISQLQPSLVVIENVRGLLSAEAHSDVEPCPWCMGDDPDRPLRALGAVLGDLAGLGFDAEWCSLYASDVGAPHGRPRVFITAWPTSDTERRGRRRWSPVEVGSEVGRTSAAGSLEGALLPTPGGYDADRGGAQHPAKRRAGGHSVSLQDALYALLPTPAVNNMGEGKTPGAWDEWTAAMQAKHNNGNGHGKSLAIELQRVESGWGPYAVNVARWEAILGRPAPEPNEPTRVREWLMGLPDGWITAVPGITRTESIRAAGNGVVPQQAAAAVRFLLNAMEVAA